MKTIFFCVLSFVIAFLFDSCNQGIVADNKQAQIDSLKTIVNQLKPGLGEFMLQIKYHHDSLGKAIVKKDYERAAYETDELKETAEKIEQLGITNDKLQKPFAVFYEKYLQIPLQDRKSVV